MTPERYGQVRASIIAAGYGHEIEWAEGVSAPANAEDFAAEAIWVILCSGMKEQIARVIKKRVWAAIRAAKPVGTAFGHTGKSAAIDTIWRDRARFFREFGEAADKVEFCETLPWIGGITKYHLAKNLGVDCAKPDVHLERLARHFQTTTATLCAGLAAATGDRVATVDLVIWRACNLGIIKTRTLDVA